MDVRVIRSKDANRPYLIMAAMFVMFVGFMYLTTIYIQALHSIAFGDPRPSGWFAKHVIERIVDNRLTDNLIKKIKAKNPKHLSSEFLAIEIVNASKRYNVPAHVLAGIMEQESRFDPYATSHAGAIGLMQVMPIWVGQIPGVVNKFQLYDPATNIQAGAYVYAQYLEKVKYNHKNALLAYNNGINQFKKHLKDKQVSINKSYADEVLAKAEIFK